MDGPRVELSTHAIERLRERYPRLRGIKAETELCRLVSAGLSNAVFMGPSVRGRKLVEICIHEDLHCYLVVDKHHKHYMVITALTAEMARDYLSDVRTRRKRFKNRQPKRTGLKHNRRPRPKNMDRD